MRGGKLFKRFLLRSVVLVIVVEIALRSFGLGNPLLYAVNPQYGYLPAPNQRLHRFLHLIEINSLGMRSVEVSPIKPAGRRRVLFIGDSVTFGTTYVDQDRIFTSLIQKSYSGRSPETEILNVSAGGWAPANESGFLQARGAYGADLVVFVLNTADLVQPFAWIPRNASYPVTAPVTAIGELWHRYLVPRLLRAPATPDPGSVLQGAPEVESQTAGVLRALSQARRLVVDKGGKLAIIFSPAVGSDIDRFRDQWAAAYGLLTNWAQAESVPILDMTQVYSAYAPSRIYFDGIHLRPLGHTLIAKSFLQWNEVACCDLPRTR